MPLIKIHIVTPEKTVFKDEVYQATLPVADGEVTILPNHRSYIASLKPGEIILKKKDKKEKTNLAISGGFIEFYNNKLTILADTAERADEIDLKRAQEARKKAEELRKKVISTDESEFARVAAIIQKEAARVKVARHYLRRKGI